MLLSLIMYSNLSQYVIVSHQSSVSTDTASWPADLTTEWSSNNGGGIRLVL